MKKEEYIRRYGQEAYDAWIAKTKEYYKKHSKEILKRQKEKYDNDPEFHEQHNVKMKEYSNLRYLSDEEFREVKRNKAKLTGITKLKYEMKEAFNLVVVQIREISRYQAYDFEKYIKDNLEKEAKDVEHNEFLTDVNYLYEHFKDNVVNDLYYGNIQILKFFIPLMSLKIARDESFTEQEIEMFKYFETFENKTKRKPISYNFKMIYVPFKDCKNYKKAIKYMLLYNLTADFMHNHVKYPTDEKLY